jgi:fructan beta-fructosidase
VAVPYELELTFGQPTVPVFGVRLYSDEQHWTEIGFDTTRKEFYIDRTRLGATIDQNFPAKTAAPLVLSRAYNLTVIVDRSSVEAYAQNGTIAMTNLIFPLSPGSTIKVFPDTAATAHAAGQIWQLSSVWEKQSRNSR